MNHLHFTIEALPSTLPARNQVELELADTLICVTTLQVDGDDLGQPLRVTFDEVAERLQDLGGLYWEPDGSFVWTASGSPRYRLEGQLFDGGAYLQHAELQGTASTAMLDRLLPIFVKGEDQQASHRLMFQLLRVGVFVDETSLRALMATYQPA